MNRKLILHSEHIPWKTAVDEKFLEICWKQPEKITMAYIPSQSDLTREYFDQKVSWYAQFWILPNHISYFDIDEEYDVTKEKDLFAKDAIFLSWGNTFYFLSRLKQRWFIEKLRKFVEYWGTLIWASAGWIIMSKTIEAASGIFNNDENITWLSNLSALWLNDFEFHPHYSWVDDEIEKLIEYSKWKVVYAVKDWDWIVINWNNIETIWDVIVFQNWEKK